MRPLTLRTVVIGLASCGTIVAQSPNDADRIRLRRHLSPSHACVPVSLRHLVQTVADQNRQSLRPDMLSSAGELQPLTFYPIGGLLDADVFNGGFVDLNPAPGKWFDFQCGPNTRDTHGGTDTEIRGFDEQAIGVPVFAVSDGTIVFAQDGFPDMNVNGGVDGNIVGIDHGGGWVSWYFHLKNGSVAASVGEQVIAGQQIGQVGSSGNSFGPHLHFEVTQDGVPYEPFAGPCREGDSGWAID